MTSQAKATNDVNTADEFSDDEDLEQYVDDARVDDTDDEGMEDDQEATEEDMEGQDETQEQGQAEETGLSKLQRKKPVIPDLSPEEALETFNALMHNKQTRKYLMSINDKIKELFVENNSTGAMLNIMKNINFMHSHHEFAEVTEEAIGAWTKVIQNDYMQSFASNMMAMKDELSKDPEVVKTVHTVKEAIVSIHENENARNLLRFGLKTAAKFNQERQMVVGILSDAMKIVEDRIKLNFIFEMGMKMAPLCENLMQLLAPEPQQPQQPQQAARAPRAARGKKIAVNKKKV